MISIGVINDNSRDGGGGARQASILGFCNANMSRKAHYKLLYMLVQFVFNA